MIEVKNIHKAFNGKEILKGITATFNQGQVNMIIGGSGTGKSVLLKNIVGLIQPDQGEVLYSGRDFLNCSVDERREIRREIGMLFQGSALFDSMTVQQNVQFPLDMLSNMTKAEKKERVDFCLERVGLSHAKDRKPSEISGGMQKRVGIARSIVLNPTYLFCDEPNSGLDPKTALVIDELIKDITVENNITTVINTHDMNSVMEIGDNIALLHLGELAWSGDKDQVLESDNDILQDFIFASPFLKRLRDKAMGPK